MNRGRVSRPVSGASVVVAGLAAGWMLLSAPAVRAQQDCRTRLPELEEARRSVGGLLARVEALVGRLEEQLAATRERLEASEDPEERARLEELAIRLAEQVQRAQDQRDEIRRQLNAFEESIHALGKCGR